MVQRLGPNVSLEGKSGPTILSERALSTLRQTKLCVSINHWFWKFLSSI